MRHGTRTVQMLLVVGALACPLAVSGCLLHHPSGPWMQVEESHYEQWERSTHRTHKDYALRGDDEQKEYWQWREAHS